MGRKSGEWRYIILLALFLLFFWREHLFFARSVFLRDLSTEIIPKRALWAENQGFLLWSPYSFFGTPYSANPQSQGFYPFNFFYLVFGAERGLVYFIFFHHLIFLVFFYLALRKLGFSPIASLLSSLGFGFGGYFLSLTLLVIVLSTLSWFPFLLLILKDARERSLVKTSFLLAPFLALQLLAGELEIAILSWALALVSVVAFSEDKRGTLFKTAGSFSLGLFWGLLVSAPQIFLTLEMLPLSNRAGGVNLEQALEYSLGFSALKSLFLPNYLFPAEAGKLWGLGFFSGIGYLLSIYLGISLLIFVIFSLKAELKLSLFWLFIFLLGLGLCLGRFLPFYRWLFYFFPGFNLFRFPEKFLLLVNFSYVLLAGIGFDYLVRRAGALQKAGAGLFGIGVFLAIFLLLNPLKVEELGNNYLAIHHYLFYRTLLRTVMIFFLVVGFCFIFRARLRYFPGLILIALVFSDYYLAHHWVNPPVSLSFYQVPSRFARLGSRPSSPVPVRILAEALSPLELKLKTAQDIIKQGEKLRDSLNGFWSYYFKINNLTAFCSFYLQDIELYLKTIRALPVWARKLLLARSGVEYIYHLKWGFEPISFPFPRALVYYQAYFLEERKKVIELWSQPDFPVFSTVLLEKRARRQISSPDNLLFHPAEVLEYKNEYLKIKLEAKQRGWLVLLDTYYPGWRAYLDGKQVEIYRADGFFRAVEVPPGEHIVEFKYLPERFIYGLIASGIGISIWLAGFIFYFSRRVRRK